MALVAANDGSHVAGLMAIGATVADPLALSGDDRDLLILSPGMAQFFGAGTRVCALEAAFPGGWRGAPLPRRGFGGIGQAIPADRVVAALR